MNLPRMTVTKTDHNPNMEAGAAMDHWRCTLTYEGRRMSIIYSMGSGHAGKAPSVAQVLETLFLDATQETFTNWCSEYGYDTDSRRAERIYKACRSTLERLRKLLGNRYEAVQHAVQEA